MATHTVTLPAALTCVAFSPSPQVLLGTDMAAMNLLMRDDQNPTSPRRNGAFSWNGLLHVPNRGVLKVLPGDVVACDANAAVGWPVLISAEAIAAGVWTFT